MVREVHEYLSAMFLHERAIQIWGEEIGAQESPNPNSSILPERELVRVLTVDNRDIPEIGMELLVRDNREERIGEGGRVLPERH
jgi:hypothetical protein